MQTIFKIEERKQTHHWWETIIKRARFIHSTVDKRIELAEADLAKRQQEEEKFKEVLVDKEKSAKADKAAVFDKLIENSGKEKKGALVQSSSFSKLLKEQEKESGGRRSMFSSKPDPQKSQPNKDISKPMGRTGPR